MKASTKYIKKAAELGILRTLETFLEKPLGPGRLKRKFEEVRTLVDVELATLIKYDLNFFEHNRIEIQEYLERYVAVGGFSTKKEYTHIASVIAFCLTYLEKADWKVPDKLINSLKEIVDYYERVGLVNYREMWEGQLFQRRWEAVERGETIVGFVDNDTLIYVWPDHTWQDGDISIDEFIAHSGKSDDYMEILVPETLTDDQIESLVTYMYKDLVDGSFILAYTKLRQTGIHPTDAWNALVEALDENK